MEPDSRLSGLTKEERLEVFMLLLEEWKMRQWTLTEDGPGEARSGRQMRLNILRKMDPRRVAEMIHEIADELHVDLAPILERVGYRHGDE
jgi:hypothetical protein